MVAGVDIYEARPTYRYSPVIALLISPGHYAIQWFNLHSSWYYCMAAFIFGKIIFAIGDIVCALLQREIILLECAARKHQPDPHVISTLIGIFWLFNPITAAVSVRGNAESVLGCCILLCLLCVLRSHVLLSGLLFGVCIHLKLYPIIYAPAIYLHMCGSGSLLRVSTLLLPNRRHWLFGIGTLISLTGLTWAGFANYGWTFLNKAYFYHFSRVDIWHNFAPHFYPLYLLEGVLTHNDTFVDVSLFPYKLMPLWLLGLFERPEIVRQMASVFKVLIMLPPVILVTVLSFKFAHRQSFAWFAGTFVFVSFNKVCTSQYFLWWLVLLPPALSHIQLPPPSSLQAKQKNPYLIHLAAFKLGVSTTSVWRFLGLAGSWFLGQGCWLSFAYLHEMSGGTYWSRELWLALWMSSLLFLAVNVIILKKLMQWVTISDFQKPQDRKKHCLEHLQSGKWTGDIDPGVDGGHVRKRRTMQTHAD